MKKKTKKTLEIVLVVFIIGLSVAIFLLRDKIQSVSEVGYLGLFFLCFLTSAAILLPAPNLIIAASCALIMNPLVVALYAALGSALGEFVGYIFGTVTEDLSPKFKKILAKLTTQIRNQTLLVFILAVLPLPLFDLIGIYSGGTKMNLIKFFLSCFIGKLIKMLVYTRIYDILEWVSSYVHSLRGLQ